MVQRKVLSSWVLLDSYSPTGRWATKQDRQQIEPRIHLVLMHDSCESPWLVPTRTMPYTSKRAQERSTLTWKRQGGGRLQNIFNRRLATRASGCKMPEIRIIAQMAPTSGAGYGLDSRRVDCWRESRFAHQPHSTVGLFYQLFLTKCRTVWLIVAIIPSQFPSLQALGTEATPGTRPKTKKAAAAID